MKYAEAMSYANDGEVSPEAVTQLQRALRLAPTFLLARYYPRPRRRPAGRGGKGEKVSWTAMLPELSQGSKAKKDRPRQARAARRAGRSAPRRDRSRRPDPPASSKSRFRPWSTPPRSGWRQRAEAPRNGRASSAPTKSSTSPTRRAMPSTGRARLLRGDPGALGELDALARELGLNGKRAREPPVAKRMCENHVRRNGIPGRPECMNA